MLKLAGPAGAGAGAIGAATGTASAVPTAPKGGFAHPALLHTQADFDRMAEKVKAGAQPWTDGWKRLLSSRDSATDYQPRPVATVIRGGEGANLTCCSGTRPRPARTPCAGRSPGTPGTGTRRGTSSTPGRPPTTTSATAR
ncbi:hypothetical protein [Streptomyces sp. DG1A-41]|uniref:hypothetical protein n=1 Tax=Streptomyces sp. DG1A-41 TaxID=3125779 RepID=UPI0030CFFBD1